VAFEIPGFSFSLIAAADLSALQFHGVNVNTSGQAASPSAGGRVAGFLQNKPTLGQVGTVYRTGITKAVVGTGGVTAGDTVAVDATGAVVTAAAGNFGVGIALATAAATDIVSVLLVDLGKQ
jgi:dihydrodipicolinate reductase